MSASAGLTLAASQPATYESAWSEYEAGRMSTSVMRSLLDHDEVFRRWCLKRAEAERLKRDAAAHEDDGS